MPDIFDSSSVNATSEALAAAARGWPVVPLHQWVPPGRCTCQKGEACNDAGKHPRTRHGHNDATTDRKKIKAWDRKYPGCGWGVALGPQSGLAVIDIDPRNGGSVEALEGLVGPIETTHARTGGGGEHFIFRLPPGKITRTAHGLGPGLDVLSSVFFVLAGSPHRLGGTYAWIAHPDDLPPAEMTPRLLEVLRGKGLWQPEGEATKDRKSRNVIHRRHRIQSVSPLSLSEEEIKEARGRLSPSVRATLPTGPGQRDDLLMPLVIAVKGEGHESLEACREVIQDWWRAALPVIRNKSWDCTWIEFARAWGNYDPARAAPTVTSALSRAVAQPEVEGLSPNEVPRVKMAAALIRELCAESPLRSCFLSCHGLATCLTRALGESLSDMQALRVFEMLQRHNIIYLAVKGERGGGKRPASEWLYLAPIGGRTYEEATGREIEEVAAELLRARSAATRQREQPIDAEYFEALATEEADAFEEPPEGMCTYCSHVSSPYRCPLDRPPDSGRVEEAMVGEHRV